VQEIVAAEDHGYPFQRLENLSNEGLCPLRLRFIRSCCIYRLKKAKERIPFAQNHRHAPTSKDLIVAFEYLFTCRKQARPVTMAMV
jgi:SMC interacting uncharacterized protein involved in chromosome segregation